MIEGRVTVNGETIRELGTKADLATDDIRVDGRRIKVSERHRYVLLNKPKGYVTTRSDPERRSTVMELLSAVREYIYPVGRLDYDTEGLLILTNDGDLAARLTHPRHEVPRVYEVEVVGVPDEHDIARIARGVTIDGRRTEPARVELGPGRYTTHATLRITISEGRNRQVRRMFDSIGHPVDHLRRISIGPIKDPRLKVGYWRDLTTDEVAALKRVASRQAVPHSARAEARRATGSVRAERPSTGRPKGPAADRSRAPRERTRAPRPKG